MSAKFLIRALICIALSAAVNRTGTSGGAGTSVLPALSIGLVAAVAAVVLG